MKVENIEKAKKIIDRVEKLNAILRNIENNRYNVILSYGGFGTEGIESEEIKEMVVKHIKNEKVAKELELSEL